MGLICPAACGAEAAWLKDQVEILAAPKPAGADQPCARHPAAGAARAGRRRGRQRLPGPARRQGPGDRQARARDRGGRRPQSDAGRPAGRRQVDAGGPADRHPAAARSGRGARGQHDRQHRRAARRRPAVAPAAVPQPAPRGLDGGHGRRRQPGAARRDLAGPSGRAVPRRAAGVRPRGAGVAAAAARGRPDHGRARPGACDLSGPVPAGRRHEPLPLRPSRRRRRWPARGRRAAAPTIRRASPARCSTASTCMSRCPPLSVADMALPAPREGIGRGGGPRCRGASAAGRPVCRGSASRELRTNSEADGELLETDRRPRRAGAAACCAAPPSSCISARAATTACCASPARSPTSTAARPSASRTSPRPIAFRRIARARI